MITRVPEDVLRLPNTAEGIRLVPIPTYCRVQMI